MSERQVPSRECYFIAEVNVRPRTGDDQKSAPFTAIARTGDALRHPFWGNVVHDLDGMAVKSRIPVDFNHDPNTVVGYANHFNVESGDLEIRGALTPTKFDQTQRAQQIIDTAEQGVPWEMSISFPGDIEVEEVPDGERVTVNQREFTGPLTVIRKWPLRGVAVTPMGKDQHTSLQFSEGDTTTITIREKEPDMADQDKKPEAEVEDVKVEAVDATETDSAEDEKVSNDLDQSVDATPEAKAEPVPEPALSEAVDGKAYMTAFGRVQGALYFAEGLSMDEARTKELERLQQENAELRSRRHDEDGMDDATGFSNGGKDIKDVLQEVPGADVAEKTTWKGLT